LGRYTSQQMEAAMLGDGDDAGRRSLGSSGPRFRESTAEERAVYRKWRRGMIVFYCCAHADFGRHCGRKLF